MMTNPGRYPDPALRNEPPPKVLLDGVVERAKPARVILDERPDRIEVGLLRGLGVLGLDMLERTVNGTCIGAVGIDAGVE